MAINGLMIMSVLYRKLLYLVHCSCLQGMAGYLGGGSYSYIHFGHMLWDAKNVAKILLMLPITKFVNDDA